MGAATPRSRKVGVVINSPSASNRTRGITHAKWGPRTLVGGVSPHSTRRGTRRGVKKWSRDINVFGLENPSPEPYRAFARAPWPLDGPWADGCQAFVLGRLPASGGVWEERLVGKE